MRILLILVLFFSYGCASTGVKQESQLKPYSKDMANVYIYRQAGLIYMANRAIVKLNGQKVGTLYPKDFVKINVSPGYQTITISGNPLAGIIGKTNIPMNFEKGENYYFITGVNKTNALATVLGGVIGSAIVGGPFPTQQVNQETFDRQKYN